MILAAVVLGVVACVLGGVSFVFSEPLRGVSAGWFISWAVVFGCVAVWVLFFRLGLFLVVMVGFWGCWWVCRWLLVLWWGWCVVMRGGVCL